jgi:hypothetical protein
MLSKRAGTFVNWGCAGSCAVLIGLSGASPMRAQELRPQILFIQQDKVITFDFATGNGVESGTATGSINGVTLTNFSFTITTFPNFKFNDQVGITDIDGDQIIFENVGTGSFIFPGLQAPGIPPVLYSTAGPLVGTYVVAATSGKFVRAYPIELVLQYRAIAMNPNTPGAVGSTYVEVYAPNFFPIPLL